MTGDTIPDFEAPTQPQSSTHPALQSALELAVAAETFSMPKLRDVVLELMPSDPALAASYAELVTVVEGAATSAQARRQARATTLRLLTGLLRWCFLIEPLKLKNTKMEVRWGGLLAADDPRKSSFSECRRMFMDLAVAFGALAAEGHTPAVPIKTSVPYELPLDYRTRRPHGALHSSENVMWLVGEEWARIFRLREQLPAKEVSGAHAPFFKKVYGKITLKTYKTDRAQTGENQTNREKRWETRPGSEQFALRRDCLQIEAKLIDQIMTLDGFPSDLGASLVEAGLFSGSAERPARCPITLDTLSFREFEGEILAPRHGHSAFQVGHLNPLKAINDDPTLGHTAANVSWVSEDGNRIQGAKTLAETRAMLRRIANNYLAAGI